MITKDMLVASATAKGLKNKEHMEKDYLQDLMLFHLCRKTNLLAFKGGTALYKLYSLPRFSEDLDFSMLKNFDAKDAINKAVAEISGANIKEIKETKGSILAKIGFKGILTGYNTLRIDIITDNPVLEGFDVKNYVPPFTDINPFSVRAMKPAEVLAEKIHSLLAREKARDLYDLFFLLRFAAFDRLLVEKKLDNFGMGFNAGALARRIGKLRSLWVPELRPFVLSELPEFDIVRDFVAKKVGAR